MGQLNNYDIDTTVFDGDRQTPESVEQQRGSIHDFCEITKQRGIWIYIKEIKFTAV